MEHPDGRVTAVVLRHGGSYAPVANYATRRAAAALVRGGDIDQFAGVKPCRRRGSAPPVVYQDRAQLDRAEYTDFGYLFDGERWLVRAGRGRWSPLCPEPRLA